MSEEKGIIYYDQDFLKFSESQDDLIKENVQRILLTERGERVNNLSFGSDVKKYIFMPDMHIQDVCDECRNAIQRNEPRCTVVSCSISSYTNEQLTIDIIVKSKITSENISVSTSVSLA